MKEGQGFINVLTLPYPYHGIQSRVLFAIENYIHVVNLYTMAISLSYRLSHEMLGARLPEYALFNHT